MRTSQEIKAEIEDKFGFFPPFFEPALQNAQVLENLWQQTLSAYVNNPLPALFKEKLSAYLSRYCPVPYCMICHSCSLYSLGMKAAEVLELLESPTPTEAEIAQHLRAIAKIPSQIIIQPQVHRILPEEYSHLEQSLLYCSIFIFLENDRVENCQSEIRRILGNNYAYLVAFIGFVKTCHVWMVGHPEVAYETDRRVIEHFSALLKEEPNLADFFSNYHSKVTQEIKTWGERRAELMESKRQQEIVRQSDERLKLALEAAQMNSWDWNILTEASTVPDTYLTFLACIYPEDGQLITQAVKLALKKGAEYNIEFQVVLPDGGIGWTASKGRVFHDVAGTPIRITGVDMDITDRKQMEEQLRHDALYDALTGLPNRVLFRERLNYLIKRAKQHDNFLFAVLFLDLDRFKLVNDSLGHMVGDQLLVSLARRLEICLRSCDIVARLGGDEFAILLHNIKDVNDAIQVAERIQDQLTLPFKLSGQEVFTSVSIGIALSSDEYDRLEDLLRDADTAMYRAKALGKARHEVFDQVMHTEAVAQLQLETDLRQAIERQEFCLNYQPIVELETGIIKGFEALLRWNHPTRGQILPLEFIPLAEETGLILPIGQWVLRESCRQIYIWQRLFPSDPPLCISVNLSAKQFSQSDLLEQLEQILQHSNLSVQSLQLEITESTLVAQTESAIASVLKLQNLGIQLYMDDFGTGYSSLSYLHHFPIHTLKIDRSFITRMNITSKKLEIVGTIITLAHNLGMQVIAEGVETTEQLEQLKALNCNYAQGYLFSKPLDSQGVIALMLTQPHWNHQSYSRSPKSNIEISHKFN